MTWDANTTVEPEDRIDVDEVSWTPQGAYVRFRGPKGKRAAYVPEEAIAAARSGTSTRIAAAVAADGGPPLGAWAQALADELAFRGASRGHDPSLRSPTPLRRPAANGTAMVEADTGGGTIALAAVLMLACSVSAMVALGLILGA